MRILVTQLLNGTDAALLRGIGVLLRQEAKRANGDRFLSIDFTGIFSVSRAFAHELFQFVAEQEAAGYKVQVENVRGELEPVFEIVKRTAMMPRAEMSEEWTMSDFDSVVDEFDSVTAEGL